ncbi:MAG: hypothetical protein ACK4NW_12025, partial [Roseinatronobacter sp.]
MTAQVVTRTVWMLRAMLALQVGLAGMIVLSDFQRLAPGRFHNSSAPPASVPVQPGDQTRRYSPRSVPDDRPARPDFPRGPDTPARLRFTESVVDGAESVSLEGRIAPGDGDRFEDYLAGRASVPDEIVLHSPGGSVHDALQIGRVIRAGGWPVTIQDGAACFSACPYILAGGAQRRVSQGALIGVHQHYFGESTILPAFLAVESIQRGQAEVLVYLDEMGIDLRLMARAMQTAPDSIYILVEAELTDFGMATEMVDQVPPRRP